MFGRTAYGQALAEGVLLAMVLVAIHLALEIREISLASAVLILLAFFLPPFWGALRLGPRGQGSRGHGVLRAASFGLQLGLLASGLGAVEKLVATVLAGQAIPIPLPLWVGVALFFAVSSAVAYALIVMAVRIIMAVNQQPEVVMRYIFPDRPVGAAGVGNTPAALAYSLVPGLGHYYLGRPQRGATFLLVAVELALAALCVVIAGLILVWEARANFEPYLVLTVIVLLSPLVLVVASLLDVLALRARPSAS